MPEFLDVAIEAAKAGGAVLLKHFGKCGVEFKADRSPVTIADKESEETIVRIIKERFPDHAFLGEEGGAHGQSDYTWIIDPLDGTLLFSHGIPEFVVLIALQYKAELVVGVAYSPVQQTLVFAEKGRGCFVDGRQVKVSSVSRLEDAYCIHEYLQGFNREPALFAKLQALIPNVRALDVMTIRAGYQYFLEGKVDAVFVAGVRPWDIAPWALMAEEAGGVATDFNGKPIGTGSTSLLLANETLHPHLFRILRP